MDRKPVALFPADTGPDIPIEVGGDLLPGGQDVLFLTV
jgi:hypothetical protein